MKKRVLLMYISKNSGHHHASTAIENALCGLSDDIETLAVDSFCYTNPILEKIVNKAYMSIIKRRPEVWGYLYDNPKVVKKTQKLRDSIHKYNSGKMRNLLESFRPNAIVATQAFPCGIVADYKKTYGYNALLAAVLTDYAPHAYWFYDNVDFYFVPSSETGEKLAAGGIQRDRIVLSGIPIDPKFMKIKDKTKIIDATGLAASEPIILLMGGSQGIGPMKEILKVLDSVEVPFQVAVVAGTNRKMYRYLSRRQKCYRKKISVFGYIENIDELMEVSSLVISKPGGITLSESLAKSLPLIIVRPIPGHEQMNTDYLVRNNVAIKVDNLEDVGVFVTEFLSNKTALTGMRARARSFSKPDSAMVIARKILERIM